MQNISQKEALEISKKCHKLYPGSENLEVMLEIFFKAKDLFLEQNGGSLNSLDVGLTLEDVGSKISNAEKLFSSPQLEGEKVKEFLAVICAGISRNNQDFAKHLEKLQETVNATVADNSNITLDNLPELVEKLVSETSLERDFVTFLMVFASSFLFCAPIEELLQKIDTSLWDEGHCPTCGEKPHYGYLSEDKGDKFLECWLCGTSWRYPRIKCPYCQSIDQEKLGFFTVEDHTVCRIHFCKECDKYHKVFDCRQLAEVDKYFILHHLHTLYFDWLAQKEGFVSGSGLKWIEEKVDETVN